MDIIDMIIELIHDRKIGTSINLSYLDNYYVNSEMLINTPKEHRQKLDSFLNINFCVNIKNLSFRANNLYQTPDFFCKFQNLITIDLSENLLIDFPEYLLDMNTIEHIQISKNKIERIPLKILKLPNLKHLDLSDNPIVDNTPKKFLTKNGSYDWIIYKEYLMSEARINNSFYSNPLPEPPSKIITNEQLYEEINKHINKLRMKEAFDLMRDGIERNEYPSSLYPILSILEGQYITEGIRENLIERIRVFVGRIFN